MVHVVHVSQASQGHPGSQSRVECQRSLHASLQIIYEASVSKLTPRQGDTSRVTSTNFLVPSGSAR